MSTYIVYSTYAGGNGYASGRGCFGSRRAAERFLAHLNAQPESDHVIYGITRCREDGRPVSPRHPGTGQPMTLYV